MSQNHPAEIRILKVGGASLASPSNVRTIVKRIQKDDYNIVVVSAFQGITNILDKIAQRFFDEENHCDALESFESAFVGYHQEIARSLGVLKTVKGFIGALKQELLETTDVDTWNSNPKKQLEFQRYLLTFGERVSAEIISQYLRKKFGARFIKKDARTLIVPDLRNRKDDGGFAPNIPVTLEKLTSFLRLHQVTNNVVVLEGFIAAGNTNLGRNGSDTTPALIACACQRIGLSVSLTYLKATTFQLGRKDVRSLSYQDFIESQFHYAQPFVHQDAVALLQNAEIPFNIITVKFLKYGLRVGTVSSDAPLISSVNLQVES